MRKLHDSTLTGSDSLTLYRIDATTIGVVQLQFWEDLDSSAVEDFGKYNAMSGTVDLGFDGSQLPGYRSADMRSALQSSGWELDAYGNVWEPYTGTTIAEHGTPAWDACVAETMWLHGSRDLAFDASGNNRRALLRDARASI